MILVASFGARAESVTVLDLTERLRDEVPVAGEVITGAMLETSASVLDTDMLFAYLPKMDGLVCAKITSFEGRYTASIKYSVTTDRQGWYQLPTSDKHKASLEGYAGGQLVVRVYTPSDNSCLNAVSYFWSRWGAVVSDAAAYRLYVNSGRYPTFLRADGEKPTVTNCVPIKGTRNFAFDSMCQVSLGHAEPLNATILRRKRGQFLPPISLSLPYVPSEIQKE
ncbi:hypothetical protein [Kordiimonas lipolytica]|uniref:hypothetical protein n=1 Tax=Kordiimonas lipolytica TaxID=1662421 RepID=UPI0012E33246